MSCAECVACGQQELDLTLQPTVSECCIKPPQPVTQDTCQINFQLSQVHTGKVLVFSLLSENSKQGGQCRQYCTVFFHLALRASPAKMTAVTLVSVVHLDASFTLTKLPSWILYLLASCQR
jgi:hypothetical protein